MDEDLYQLILSKAGEKSRFILAVDGRCASGKSALADELSRRVPASVIHMDDFFLQPRQRTPDRLSEPGGNIDRERVLSEVILPLRRGENRLRYGKFNCHQGKISETIDIRLAPLVILEGSYSAHPAFENTAHFKLFLTVSQLEQKRRIIERNGPERWLDFQNLWIPKEEIYFNSFDIPRHCDLIYNTETHRAQSVSDTIHS